RTGFVRRWFAGRGCGVRSAALEDAHAAWPGQTYLVSVIAFGRSRSCRRCGARHCRRTVLARHLAHGDGTAFKQLIFLQFALHDGLVFDAHFLVADETTDLGRLIAARAFLQRDGTIEEYLQLFASQASILLHRLNVAIEL